MGTMAGFPHQSWVPHPAHLLPPAAPQQEFGSRPFPLCSCSHSCDCGPSFSKVVTQMGLGGTTSSLIT